MEKAKLFQNGSSQAVRLPREFRMPGTEVKIYKKGSQVILEPMETKWDAAFEALDEFPDKTSPPGSACTISKAFASGCGHFGRHPV